MALNTLPTLTWRMTAAVNVAAPNGIADVLQAVVDALALDEYHDASARVPGTDLAWASGSVEGSGATAEGLLLVPPSGSPIGNFKGVLGGSAAAKTPAMLSPDTWLASSLHAGYGKVGGTYTEWDNATPFGAAHFSGHSRCSVAATSYLTVRLLECDEGICVIMASATTVSAVLMGALWESITDGALDCESDGRVYGLMTTGSANVMDTSFATNDTGWTNHSGSNGNCHVTYTTFGGSTQRTATRVWKAQNNKGALSGKSPANGVRTYRQYYEDSSTVRDVGRLREIELGWDAQCGQVVSVGGTPWAYVLSGNPAAVADSLMFKH